MDEPTISSRAYVQLAPFCRLSTFVTTSFSLVFSLEEALRKVLPPLLSNPLGTARGARVEFYDKFQRGADEYDRDFMKKCDEDLNTTLIFVSVLFHIRIDRGVNLLFWTDRPGCSLRSHPLSLSTFRATSNRISNR
jgi:hypothetical protein